MKIHSVALALIVCLSSLPALASPLRDDPSGTVRHRLDLHGLARVVLDFRAVPSRDGRPEGIDGVRPVRDQWAEVAPHSMLRTAVPRPTSDIAPIPEPSATTLFGVGLVLALQAIPRGALRSRPDSESKSVRTR